MAGFWEVASKVYCQPACAGCMDAGTCPRGQVPASMRVRVGRSRPRRRVAASYPRDVRQVYLHLGCGHPTTQEAQVFFSVWREKGSAQLYCEICHGWRDVEVREAPPADRLNF